MKVNQKEEKEKELGTQADDLQCIFLHCILS